MFIQNLAPAAGERAGFGSEQLRRRHERLITVDISGYGAGNDYADMTAYDLLIQAESGLAAITGHPAGPGRVGVSACDIACGMSAHAGVLEALIARSVTGHGRRLEISLFDGMADWMNVPLLYFEGTGTEPQRLGLAHPSICPCSAFETLDGSQVLISIQNEQEWVSFCAAVLGDPGLATAAGFDSNNARVGNRPTVDARIGRCFRAVTRDGAADSLRRSGTAYGFVNTLPGLAAHPALRRVSVYTPGGPATIVAPPVIHDGAVAMLGKVPSIGEHDAAIRAEFGDDTMRPAR